MVKVLSLISLKGLQGCVAKQLVLEKFHMWNSLCTAVNKGGV